MTEVSRDHPVCRRAGGPIAPGEDRVAGLDHPRSGSEDALPRLHAMLLSAAPFQVSRQVRCSWFLGRAAAPEPRQGGHGLHRHPQSAGTARSALPASSFRSTDGLDHRSDQQASRGGRGSSDRGREQTVLLAHGGLPGRGAHDLYSGVLIGSTARWVEERRARDAS